MASRREPPRRRPRRGASDLTSRIIVAIPAIAFAIAIIYFGGAVFALGVLALGLVCISELFTMLERMKPVRLAGFLGISGLVAAAALGDANDVLLALVAFLPVLFGLTLLSPIRERISLSLAATVLGVYWIGLGLANAVLLRELEHGGALVFMVLLGHVPGRHRRLPRRPRVRHAPARAAGVAEQDVGGARDRRARVRGLGLVRQPHLRRQLDHRHRGAAARGRGGVRRADRRPVRVADQARRRVRRTPAACSASTAVRWTASTRRCSP